jgi:site-specific recombinase XerD
MNSSFELVHQDNTSALTIAEPQRDTVADLLYEFIRGRPKTTGRSYKRDLQEFFVFTNKHFGIPRVEGSTVHFGDIRRVHVVKYHNFLEETVTKLGKPLAPNSINRKISSVSSFYQFLLQRDVVDKNPVEFCKRPKRINVRDTEAFNDTEMKEFFRLVIRKAPPLHKAALLLLFTTGMRNHELRNIKLADFENREGIKVLRYIGKGQKVNHVPIHPVAGYHVGQYLDYMAGKGRSIGLNDYLFQASKCSEDNAPGRPLSHTALGYIVKKWARKVNLAKRITPHSARATFISSLLENGEDIYSVAQAVNHADVRTTARYDKRKQNFNKSPVFGLKFFS